MKSTAQTKEVIKVSYFQSQQQKENNKNIPNSFVPTSTANRRTKGKKFFFFTKVDSTEKDIQNT